MSIPEQLLARDWKAYPNHLDPGVELYAKLVPGHCRCLCNPDKHKQIEVYHHKPDRIAKITMPEAWKVKVDGKLPDGSWVRMSSDDPKTADQIEACAQRLLRTWDYLFSITPPAL